MYKVVGLFLLFLFFLGFVLWGARTLIGEKSREGDIRQLRVQIHSHGPRRERLADIRRKYFWASGQSFCSSCHGSFLRDLRGFITGWRKIKLMISNGGCSLRLMRPMMPPLGVERPNAEEVQSIMDWLASHPWGLKRCLKGTSLS